MDRQWESLLLARHSRSRVPRETSAELATERNRSGQRGERHHRGLRGNRRARPDHRLADGTARVPRCRSPGEGEIHPTDHGRRLAGHLHGLSQFRFQHRQVCLSLSFQQPDERSGLPGPEKTRFETFIQGNHRNRNGTRRTDDDRAQTGHRLQRSLRRGGSSITSRLETPGLPSFRLPAFPRPSSRA